MDARAFGVQLLFLGQFRFQAGDVAGQLFGVECWRGHRRFGDRFGFFGFGRAFFGFGATVVTAALGAGFLLFRLGRWRWRDFLHLVVLKGATSVVLGIAFLSSVPLPC